MPMSHVRRELILKVVDGRNELLPFAHYVTRFQHADRIFGWFLQNNVTGLNLVSFLAGYRPSMMKPVAEVLRMINERHHNDAGRIKMGRDWIG